MAQMNVTPFEEILDDFYGKIGTPVRDQFEAEVAEAVEAYKLGEAIKNARTQQNLTQEELGERMGVKKAQISRLEKGGNVSYKTMKRAFKALGFQSATLVLGSNGNTVPLW